MTATTGSIVSVCCALHAAAEHAHTLLHASIRDSGKEPARKDAVADFRAALESVEELPQRSEREQRVARVIQKQGRDLIKELQLLEMLLSSPGRVLSRQRILDKIWNYDTDR